MQVLKSVSLIVVGLMMALAVQSQSTDSTYLDYLLNNPEVPKRYFSRQDAQHLIKTDLADLIAGRFPLIWEYRISEKIGFDASLGLILPYNFIDAGLVFGSTGYNLDESKSGFQRFLPTPVFVTNGFSESPGSKTYVNKKYGHTFYIHPRYYFLKRSRMPLVDDLCAIGLFYKYKSYSDLKVNEFGLSYSLIIDDVISSAQLCINLSYQMQSPLYDVKNVRFSGRKFDSLTRYGLPSVGAWVMTLNIPIGFILK
jgi:hypothetical protein